MLCENCKENEANVSYTQIINGVKKEMHLCSSCAKELGISNIGFEMPSFNMPISLSSFLGDFFEDEKELLPIFKEEELKCGKCGMTYEEFINSGKFGCEECYKTFSKKIEPILKNIHGGTVHVGRKLINEGKTNIKQEDNKIVQKQEQSKSNEKLEKLKSELKNAIKEERYEDAAKIRDEIKKLKK